MWNLTKNYEPSPQKKIKINTNLNFEVKVVGRDVDESRLLCLAGWRMVSPTDRDNVEEIAEKENNTK